MATVNVQTVATLSLLTNYMKRDKSFNDPVMTPRILVEGARGGAPESIAYDFTRTREELSVDPDRAEGKSLVFGFGLDEINPNDPDQVQMADRAVELFMETDRMRHFGYYRVGQADGLGRDGCGGKFHEHVALNSVALADFEFEGRQYHRGDAFAGPVGDIEGMRRDFDECLRQAGLEQKLEPYTKGTKRSIEDVAARREGRLTKVDDLRERIDEAMSRQPGDLDELDLELGGQGVELRVTTRTSGKYKGNTYLAYRLQGDEAWTTSKRLGEDRYGYLGVRRDMADPSKRKPLPSYVPPGPPRPMTTATPADLAQAQQVREQLLAEWREQHPEAVEQVEIAPVDQVPVEVPETTKLTSGDIEVTMTPWQVGQGYDERKRREAAEQPVQLAQEPAERPQEPQEPQKRHDAPSATPVAAEQSQEPKEPAWTPPEVDCVTPSERAERGLTSRSGAASRESKERSKRRQEAAALAAEFEAAAGVENPKKPKLSLREQALLSRKQERERDGMSL